LEQSTKEARKSEREEEEVLTGCGGERKAEEVGESCRLAAPLRVVFKPSFAIPAAAILLGKSAKEENYSTTFRSLTEIKRKIDQTGSSN
jgi:hypothetical protein